VLQLAGEARERKKKFSGSVEVLRFERTLELTRRQLRKTDNIARNDARLRSTMTLMFHETKNSPRSTWGHNVESCEPAVTTADLGDPADLKATLPETSQCCVSQELVEKCATRDVRDAGCVISSVAVTTASATNATSSLVAMTSIAEVTASVTRIPSVVTTSVPKMTASVMSVASMTTTSFAVAEASSVSSSLSANSATGSEAHSDVVKLTSSRLTATHPSLLSSTVATKSSPTAAVQSSVPFSGTTNTSSDSLTRSADAVTVKLIDSVAEKSTNYADPTTFTVGKSVHSVAVLADAATVKSVDSVSSTSAKSIEAITVMVGKSADATARSADEVTMISPVPVVATSFQSLPILSPVPLSNVKSLSTPQSPSPSPKGHVTFSDHVTEIHPSVDGGGAGVNGKPRRIPPAPPPRRAIKNVGTIVCPASPGKPRDRPSSAVEPLATTSVDGRLGFPDGRPGFPTVNGIGRVRPYSMAPLATVDSDSDSSVGTESQTGTIRRNTSQSSDKRNLAVELRNGARGRTPPPVPTRKTSSLSSSFSSATTDVQYSNLHDVREECARLELASGPQDGRLNGTKNERVTKCEETEIY